jgi:hypothetical protein
VRDTASGDLIGLYPNPVVVKLWTRPVSNALPTAGQALVWDGAKWAPGTPAASGTSANTPNTLVQRDASGSFRAGSLVLDGNLQVGTIGAQATGVSAVALGNLTQASGHAATALGNASKATGLSSTAMGAGTTASGDFSTAMGLHASTNNRSGAFVYGDASDLNATVSAVVNNQFVVRAQHIWLGTTSAVGAAPGRFVETSTGAYLSSGGAWTNASDINRKHLFAPVSAERVLEKVARLPIREWSYRGEAATVRHLGPTAQDFRATFGLGADEKAIATVDADGVSLLAIQALERRSAEQRR